MESPGGFEQRSDGTDAAHACDGERYGAFDPFNAEQNIAAGTRYVTALMWEFHGDLRLVSAAYYAGDRGIAREQLNYRNPDVVGYVQAVRSRYMLRKYPTARPPRRSLP